MKIDDDRIKTITACFDGQLEELTFLKEKVLEEIAHGIISKLREFHKVKTVDTGQGNIRAWLELDIIVPKSE